MKRLALIAAILTAFSAIAAAQTADEIIQRMDQEVNKGDVVGASMIFDMRIPIIGTVSSSMKMLGDLSRADTDVKGEKIILWMDKETSWTYTSSKNEIVIENVKDKQSSNQDDDMLKGITEGYSAKLVGETADTWQILCTKTKENKSKDDPKKMDLVVSKKTYMPVSLTAKVKGFTFIIHDYTLGVQKAEVTFDPSAYPGVKITDKR